MLKLEDSPASLVWRTFQSGFKLFHVVAEEFTDPDSSPDAWVTDARYLADEQPVVYLLLSGLFFVGDQ